MSWVKKLVIFIGLFTLFLFSFSVNEFVVDKIEANKTSSNYSIDAIDSSAFIQPQTINNTFTYPHKTPNFSVSKYFETFLIKIPVLKIGILLTFFSKQTIATCQMVLLLLFPFHYFW